MTSSLSDSIRDAPLTFKGEEFYSAIDEIADKEAFLESVREGFSEIEDPRGKDNQSYRLVDLLVIILCAILAGQERTQSRIFMTTPKLRWGCCSNFSR